MKNNNEIYVFGHRNPDTDSVTSAISLAYLKQQLGLNAIPAILMPVNDETKYVLDYFQVETPKIIDDVKIKVKDLEYSKDYTMTQEESIFDAYNYMSKIGISKIPVIDEEKNMLGIVSMKDIAKAQFTGKYNEVNATYDNIVEILEGKEIVKIDEELQGTLYVAAYDIETIKKTNVLNENAVLILGDREPVIEYAINQKVKLIILTGDHTLSEQLINLATKNQVNIISTQYDSLNATRVFNLCNKVSTIMNKEKVLCINENQDLSEFISIANKTRYSYYPVFDNNSKCLGILRFSDVGYNNKKQVILVDHNAYDQSAIGLDEANILEVIDHHNISTIVTGAPISFRTMPVGSTCTIVATMFEENQIEIPKAIAGLLISGILSDTLILTSPTTTEIDKEMVKKLAKIAEVDYEKYGFEMLKAGTSITGKTKEQIVNNDFKIYEVNDLKYAACQFFTLSIDEIMNEKDEYIDLLNRISDKNNYEFVVFAITDIIKNGSYVFYSNRAEGILKAIWHKDTIHQGIFIDKLVSRKKQLVPFIMEEMSK